MKINLSKLYTLLFVLTLIVTVCSTGKIYNGLNSGIAWNHGGIELLPAPAVFLCSGNYDSLTGQATKYYYPTFLESFVTDC